MKNILFTIIALSLSSMLYSQTYKYGAMFSGTFIKAEGKIVVSENDSTVIYTAINNGIENTDHYKLVKKVNKIVYFTDGVKTHSFVVNKETGKKKGFDYNCVLIMSFEGAPMNLMYYCIEE
jgi:hypothetical protein